MRPAIKAATLQHSPLPNTQEPKSCLSISSEVSTCPTFITKAGPQFAFLTLMKVGPRLQCEFGQRWINPGIAIIDLDG